MLKSWAFSEEESRYEMNSIVTLPAAMLYNNTAIKYSLLILTGLTQIEPGKKTHIFNT